MLLFVRFISYSLEYTINVVHRFTIDIKQKEEKNGSTDCNRTCSTNDKGRAER